MTDRPIPFSPPMVRAILREIEQPGTGKTQTRRVLAGKYSVGPAHGVERCGAHWIAREYDRTWPLRFPHAPGDRLWVKEAYHLGDHLDDLSPSKCSPSYVWYVAGGKVLVHGRETNDPIQDSPGRYRHARFMPRWASRITLIVTDVRVERLQDISEDDAIAEGMTQETADAVMSADELAVYASTHVLCPHAKARILFNTYWDHLHGDGSWEANPWVAVYGFRPVLANIDQTEPTHD